MPQARHGGNGVFTVATRGSNVEGTGLENVQIVQTHVAAFDLGALGESPFVGTDVVAWCRGEGFKLREGYCCASCKPTIPDDRPWNDDCF